MSSNFSAGTPCEPCKVNGHFCQAFDFNNDDDPACQPCLNGASCPQMKSRAPEFSGAVPKPDLCPYCKKPQHRGTCRERAIAKSQDRKSEPPRKTPTLRDRMNDALDDAKAKANAAAAPPASEGRQAIDRAFPPARELMEQVLSSPLAAKILNDPENEAAVKQALGIDDGEVVDLSILEQKSDQPELDARLDHALTLPAGKGLRFTRDTESATRRFYEQLRGRLRARQLNLVIRRKQGAIYLYRKES